MTRRFWTADEDDQLLANAGKFSVNTIARQLNRTPGAVRQRYSTLSTVRMLDNVGMTALDVARAYNCPMHRVYQLLKDGTMRARKPAGSPYWRISVEEAERHREALTAPKTTWKADPPATGPRRPWEPCVMNCPPVRFYTVARNERYHSVLTLVAALERGAKIARERRHSDPWLLNGDMHGMRCQCGFRTRSHYVSLDATLEMCNHLEERHIHAQEIAS